VKIVDWGWVDWERAADIQARVRKIGGGVSKGNSPQTSEILEISEVLLKTVFTLSFLF
jgi:hypothetical protein